MKCGKDAGRLFNCPDIEAWMRYMAIVKCVASREPRFFVSARFLQSTNQHCSDEHAVMECLVPRKYAIPDCTDHICESLSTDSLDLTNTSRAFSPEHISQYINDNATWEGFAKGAGIT